MRAGGILMLSGAALATIGGVFIWRGYARYHSCRTDPPNDYALCTPLNAPMITGWLLTPAGLATVLVGGAVALAQSGEANR